MAVSSNILQIMAVSSNILLIMGAATPHPCIIESKFVKSTSKYKYSYIRGNNLRHSMDVANT